MTISPRIKLLGVGAIGVVAGTGLGYFIGYKRVAKIEKKIREDLISDMISTQEHFDDQLARIQKTGQYATVEEAASVLLPAETEGLTTDEDHQLEFFDEYDNPEYEASTEDLNDEENDVDVSDFIERFKNRSTQDYGGVTFPGQVDSVDEDAEQAEIPVATVPEWVTVRDPHGPYVISLDEYMEEGEDSPYTKIEMTYFEGDETLVDINDSIVPNIDEVIGVMNLDRWGQGTTDPEQVYIRNERLELDIELTRDEQTYTRVILKIIPEDEIARSMLKPLKMREGDDN